MKSQLISAVLFLCSVAQGQAILTSTTGWNFGQTRGAATDIVVADLINGSGVDAGAEIRANASIQVGRVLQGESRPGAGLSLEWRYQARPFDPATNVQIPAVHALFFLRKNASGTFEPLRMSGAGGEFGGVYVEMPRTESSRVRSLPQDAPLDERLAREIQWGLEELSREHGAELDARPAPQPAKSQPAAPPRARIQLQGLFEVIDSLRIENSLAAFRDLSEETDPNLKLLGLMGRLKGKDTSAFLEMEKELPTLTPAFNAFHWSVPRMDLRRDLPAAHAMGRIAISETPLPQVEAAFGMSAAATRSLELLPYLAVMLKSPSISLRDSTLIAWCELIRSQPAQPSKPVGLWVPEMSAYCPNQSPMSDHEQEQKDLEYWSRWWDSHSFEIGQTAALPIVKAPARYQAALGYVQSGLTPEQRFSVVLPRRNAPGGKAPLADRVAAQLTSLIQAKKASAADLDAWNEVAQATNARLTENDKRARDLLVTVRTQGPAAVQGIAHTLDLERQDILRGGLQDLRSRLSMNAWAAMDGIMKSIAGGSFTPVPPKQ
jgi:hypothetical protein